MRPYRGLTKEGNWFYGNLIVNNATESDGIHKAEPLKTYIRERTRTWISDEYNKCWTHLTFEVIPETVGQQVGLKDKKGKEDAYKGDIVICSCDTNPKLRFKGVIKYSAPEFYLACFWEDIDGEQCSFPVGKNNRSLVGGVWSIDEIIGNIHTTPELLEQENG